MALVETHWFCPDCQEKTKKDSDERARKIALLYELLLTIQKNKAEVDKANERDQD